MRKHLEATLFNLLNRHDRRVTFVMSHDHRYTARALLGPLAARQVQLDCLSYERLFALSRIGRGSFIFTDFDRLSPMEVEVARRLFHRLRAEGVAVLNDPGQFRPRHAMLAMLERRGMNRISIWWPAAGEMPDRFPVLLRTLAAHRGPIGDLCTSAEEAEAALERALAQGRVLADLAFLTFAAEPNADGVWQKHAAFRLGDTIVRANTVNDAGWMVKTGTRGIASPEVYAQELAEMSDYPHRDYVMGMFQAVGIDYGRIDFAIVEGRPTTYEINSNPFVPGAGSHPDPSRAQTQRMVLDQLADAIAAFASSRKGPWIDLLPGVKRRVTRDRKVLRRL